MHPGPELTLLRLTVPGRAGEKRNHKGAVFPWLLPFDFAAYMPEQSVSDVLYAQATDAQQQQHQAALEMHRPLTSWAATPVFSPANGVCEREYPHPRADVEMPGGGMSRILGASCCFEGQLDG